MCKKMTNIRYLWCRVTVNFLWYLKGTDGPFSANSDILERNMESISRISRREKRNVEICFLVRKENEILCKRKSRNLQFSPILRRQREILKTNLMIREEIETSRFQIFRDEKEKFTYHQSHFYFCFFCPKKRKSSDAQFQNTDCVFDNTITLVLLLTNRILPINTELSFLNTFPFCKTLLVKIQPNSKI